MNRICYTFAVIILFVTSAFAKLIRVPANQPTIQAAINTAAKGDTVLVAGDTYYENINFKGKAITVASYFLIDGDTTHINNTIINGSKPSHADSGSVVFFISGEDTASVLCGFTITGGTGTEVTPPGRTRRRAGGGILCYNSGARIVNNKIVQNTVNSLDHAVVGGGLAVLPVESTAYIILQNNQITHNRLTANREWAAGGGVEFRCNGRVVNNLISYNSIVHQATDYQAYAGGVNCASPVSDRRNVILEANKITHNSVVGHSATPNICNAMAGGVLLQGIQGRFSKNEISQNEVWANADKNGCGAGIVIVEVPDSFIIEGNIIRGNGITNGTGLGGGLDIRACNPRLTNNIVAGNLATNGGGGYISQSSEVQLINNTIISNQASSGGGLFVKGSAKPVLLNSILWNNQAPTNAGIHIEAGTVKAAYCSIQGGWSGAENKNQDPLLVADSLSPASPCIDAGIKIYDFGNGNICSSPDKDINGRARPFSSTRPDMGAWESMEKIAGIASEPGSAIPASFALYQNHPNPFSNGASFAARSGSNSGTTIEFALPEAGFVTLKIYDLLGNEVATLVTEKLQMGKHQRVWNAKGLASGVYLYRLEAGEFFLTRKLIVLR